MPRRPQKTISGGCVDILTLNLCSLLKCSYNITNYLSTTKCCIHNSHPLFPPILPLISHPLFPPKMIKQYHKFLSTTKCCTHISHPLFLQFFLLSLILCCPLEKTLEAFCTEAFRPSESMKSLSVPAGKLNFWWSGPHRSLYVSDALMT